MRCFIFHRLKSTVRASLESGMTKSLHHLGCKFLHHLRKHMSFKETSANIYTQLPAFRVGSTSCQEQQPDKFIHL